MRHAMIRPRYLLYSLIGMLYALILLLINLDNPIVYLVWVFSLMVVVLRIRFKKLSEGIVIDFIVYALLIYFLDVSIFYMVLPSIVISVYGQMVYGIIIGYILWFVLNRNTPSTLLIITLINAVSILLYIYKTVTLNNQKDLDQLRQETYKLENEQVNLLDAQAEISRLSTLEERDRIAQSLHDNLGHELTGALLALRAFTTLHPSLNDDASIQSVESRLKKSVESLKDTVSHTKVDQHYGFEYFKQLLNAFKELPIESSYEGAMITLHAMHWQVLNSVLKEALTNIQKHANATSITINLTIERKVVTLSIKNDGVLNESISQGMGLHYMRKRLEALNGSLSIQKDYHFTLRALIPIALNQEVES